MIGCAKNTCQNCGALHDRDLNAAINIKNIGMSGLGKSVEPAESSPKGETMKQEFINSHLNKHK